MNTNPYKKNVASERPIATLHYLEAVYSVFDPTKLLQTNAWERDFWSKAEIKHFFEADPTHPRSYITRKPTKVTWPATETENATCDVNRDWDAAKRVLEMLAKK